MAVAPGGEAVTRVRLFTRAAGAPAWTESAMKHRGRRTYEAEIAAPAQAGALMDFYVEASFRGSASKAVSTAPVEAPKHFYTVTLV